MTYTSREVYEHISTQNNDPILEWKTCRISGQEFPIYQTDLDFYNKISPTFETTQEIGDKLITKFPNHYSQTDDGKLRVQISTPTLCPEERQRRRLLMINQTNLYRSICQHCHKDMVSRINPNGPVSYCVDCRPSEQWDMYQYGQGLDASFYDTLLFLVNHTPFQSLIGSFSNVAHNASYTNYTADIKDSYMVFEGDFLEECLYCVSSKKSNQLVDCYEMYKSDNCYECVGSRNLYRCYYCVDSQNCRDSYRLNNCQNCDFCINCSNLSDKRYWIDNEPSSKEEYNKYIKKYGFNMINMIRSQSIVNSENIYGNHISNSRDVVFSYEVADSSFGRYSSHINNSHDFYDVDYYGSHSSLLFDSSGVGRYSHHVYWSDTVGRGERLFYCMNVKKSSYCFGCVNLKGKQYCIFNKQYTKEQRHSIVPQLIARMIHDGEWGEFFNPSLSPFGYNETVAQEYFPLTKKEAIARGYKRSDYSADPVIPANAQVLRPGEISAEAWTKRRDDDTILRQVILCEASERPFMIQKMELDFYRKHNLPLPRKHPDVRHEERMKLRPGRTLHLRTCDKCGEEMLSVYPKVEGQEQKVYCEKCYQQEVFG